MDYDFIRRVDITARRVFQRRWLKDCGKLTEICPADASRRRSSLQGGTDLASQLCYAVSYGIAFGVTIPLALAARGLSSFENAVARASQDGAALASHDADRFRARLRAGTSSHLVEPRVAEPEPLGLAVGPSV